MGERTKIKVGGWIVTPALNLMESGGRSVKVQPRAMDVLLYLAKRAGEVVTTDELIAEIWPSRVVGDDSVYDRIKKLRKAFRDDPRAPSFIETIPKRGYRLIAPVETLPLQTHRAGAAAINRLLPQRWQQVAVLVSSLCVVTIAPFFLLSSWFLTRTDQRVDARTIAVLPFANLNGNEGDDYLGEGIAEEIIHALSNGSGLRVIARTSSFSFQGTSADVREIGERLGASIILEGSVRRENGRLRIIAQLIDTESGSHLWSDDFDQPLEDLITVERDIALAVAQRLMGEEADVRRIAAALPPLEDLDAYEYYLLGRQRMRNPSGLAREWPEAEANRAIEYFRRAVTVDPAFARGYAALADALLNRTRIAEYRSRGNVSEEVREAAAAIDRALALDPQLAEAYVSRALAFRLLEGDNQRAEEAYRHAISLNPNLANPHYRLGMLLRSGGDDETLVELQTAARLDPMSTEIHLWLGTVLQENGDWEQAVAALTTAVQLDPESARAHLQLGTGLKELGRFEEAAPHFERGSELDPRHLYAFRNLAKNQLALGRPDRAIHILEPLLGNPDFQDEQSSMRADISEYYLDLNDSRAAEALIGPIEEPLSSAMFTRFYLALGQDQYGIAADLTHRAEPGRRNPLLEMVIGHDDHAREEFEEIALRLEGDLSSLDGSFQWGQHDVVNAANLYLESGDADTAAVMLENIRRALNPALEDQYTAGGGYYLLASIHALEGRSEDALASLELAIARGWTRHWYAVRDPNLESLWDEPRFQVLIAGVRTEMDRLRVEMQARAAAE